MAPNDPKRNQLLELMSRGVAISAPVIVAVAGLASVHAIVSDAAVSDRGYYMSAAGEGEGEAEGRGEGAGEAEGEARGAAEGEGEARGAAEGEGEGEARGEGEGEGEGGR